MPTINRPLPSLPSERGSARAPVEAHPLLDRLLRGQRPPDRRLRRGARLLVATAHPEYLVAWVAPVVGVHFVAFGRLFLTGFYWLGAALITAGVAGVLVGIAGGGPAGIKVMSGLMAAASLFTAGCWSIARMRSRSHA